MNIKKIKYLSTKDQKVRLKNLLDIAGGSEITEASTKLRKALDERPGSKKRIELSKNFFNDHIKGGWIEVDQGEWPEDQLTISFAIPTGCLWFPPFCLDLGDLTLPDINKIEDLERREFLKRKWERRDELETNLINYINDIIDISPKKKISKL